MKKTCKVRGGREDQSRIIQEATCTETSSPFRRADWLFWIRSSRKELQEELSHACVETCAPCVDTEFTEERSCPPWRERPPQHQLALAFEAIAARSSHMNHITEASLHNPESVQKNVGLLLKFSTAAVSGCKIFLIDVSPAPTHTHTHTPTHPALLCTAFIMRRSCSQVRTSPSLAGAGERVGVAASAPSSVSG